MQIDRNFIRDLKKISPDLSAVWEPTQRRVVIYYKASDGGTYPVHTVQEPGTGEFKKPDQRDLDLLRRSDMSSKVHDANYYFTKQYEESKRQKRIQVQKQRDEAQYRSKQLSSKWKKAIDNAENGIFNERQLGRQTVYSLPTPLTYRKVSQDIINKLGRPQITGDVTHINPNKGEKKSWLTQ